VKGYNPNVQAVKNKFRVIKYITKEDKEPLSHGIDPSQY